MKKYFLIILVMTLSVNIAKSQTHYENQDGNDMQNANRETALSSYQIIGSTSLSGPCQEYSYQLNPAPGNLPVTWEVSPNIELICGDGTPFANIRPIGPGSGFIKAHIQTAGGEVIETKDVTISSAYTTFYCNYTANTSMTLNEEQVVIAGTFTIPNGVTVTITSPDVLCSPDTKIIIQTGGKLILNNGNIGNLCPGRLWDGIYVHGNNIQPQTEQYQGTLEINQGWIINARKAICVWDGNAYETAGGIVKCYLTTFYNNGRIEFQPYIYTENGVESNNVSYFNRCSFLVDDNTMIYPYSSPDNTMILLYGVKGINIRGCTFRDLRNNPTWNYNAIRSSDAGYFVTEHCTGLPNFFCSCSGTSTRSSFHNTEYGIVANNTGSSYSPNISRTDFYNCYIAFHANQSNNLRFTENNVYMNNGSLGAYLDHSTGYKIEGNTFRGDDISFNETGILIYNSGEDYNTIYRNTFNILKYGISSGWNAGLQFLCNNFTSISQSDIYINGTISQSQGSSLKSAGNKFSSWATSNINTFNNGSISYYYNGNASPSNVFYPATVANNVSRTPTPISNDCSSTLCNFIIIHPPIIIEPIIGKSAPINDDISLYESLQQAYESRLAEYNTGGYDFLIKNFDENASNIVNNAMRMQDTLISISQAMAEIANSNINAILQDTLGLDRNLLNAWYNRINTLTAKYSLVNSYFETGEYDLARQELASIPQRFALDEKKLAEYDNFCQYNALRESVFKSNRNYYQLTEEEIAELNIIAERNTGISSAYANSILCFFYGICRDKEPEIDFDMDNTPNTPADLEEGNANAESFAIYVYPNPADEELNILFNNLPDGKNTIEIHDITGRLMFTQEITSTNTSINISSLKQGVYMYRIVNDGNVIARDKIVKE
ncbi:MAG: T9SS type A sorting domain-containing protein [Bacteroidales bacterium]|nr:T9SS type A sorting domain-containing protein [Bacteroidales bacterium]